MKDINTLLAQMTPERYQQLKTAVELGKWENGLTLTQEQRAMSQQLVILYQAHRLDQDEHFTVNAKGKINELSKSQLKQQFRGESIAAFNGQDLD